MQVDMVLRKGLFHVDMQATGSKVSYGRGWSLHEPSKAASTVTYVLQQSHTS